MGLVYTGKNLRLYSGDFRKDGTTQYQIRFVDDAGKRVTRRAPADVDPLDWAKEMDSIVAQSGKIVADARHMNVLMEEYKKLLLKHVKNYEEDAKHGTKLSNATFSKNRSYIDQHIIPYFGAKNIAHVTPKNILKWQDWMQARIAPQTANAVLGVLNRAMSHFVLEEYIPFNPCSEIKNLPIADVEQGYTPTVDEIYRLLDEAHHRNFVDDVAHQTYVGDERDLKTWMWHHLLLRLCAETGIRISEALGLEWSKVRGDAIIISQACVNARVGKVKTKDSNRTVPIGQTLSALFKEYRFIAGTHQKFIFLNSEGNHFRPTCVQRQVLTPAIRRAGITEFGWHGLRRAYITHLYDTNVQERHIQKLCGHAPGSKMTRGVYDQVREKDVQGHVVSFG